MDMKDVVPDREIVNTDGTQFICMEVAPGAQSPVVSDAHTRSRCGCSPIPVFVMLQHRTDSIDYVILSVYSLALFPKPTIVLD